MPRNKHIGAPTYDDRFTCAHCGENTVDVEGFCTVCGNKVVNYNDASIPHGFSVWKLVSGILSIILFILVAFQSCAAGVANSLLENEEVSGSAGMIVAIMLLVGGIVSIATRNSVGIASDISLIILFGSGALFGFVLA